MRHPTKGQPPGGFFVSPRRADHVDPGLLQIAASLGIGGVIAVLTLQWKRADDLTHRDELKTFVDRMDLRDKEHRDELKTVVDRMEARDKRLLDVITAHTQVLVALQRSVEALASLARIEERMAAMEEGLRGEGQTRR